jgi:hypothetical protein
MRIENRFSDGAPAGGHTGADALPEGKGVQAESLKVRGADQLPPAFAAQIPHA